MMSYVWARWERNRTSFWLLTPLMARLGRLFAELLRALDQRIPY
jgi:hypothetical protein